MRAGAWTPVGHSTSVKVINICHYNLEVTFRTLPFKLVCTFLTPWLIETNVHSPIRKQCQPTNQFSLPQKLSQKMGWPQDGLIDIFHSTIKPLYQMTSLQSAFDRVNLVSRIIRIFSKEVTIIAFTWEMTFSGQ